MASNGGHRVSASGTWAEGGANPPGSGWVADGAAPAGNALAGLDALDLAGRPGGGRGGFALRFWNALWPKALAILLVLGIWELITLSGYKKQIFPGAGRRWPTCGTRPRPGRSGRPSATRWRPP